jgi:hypothetical protein
LLLLPVVAPGFERRIRTRSPGKRFSLHNCRNAAIWSTAPGSYRACLVSGRYTAFEIALLTRRTDACQELDPIGDVHNKLHWVLLSASDAPASQTIDVHCRCCAAPREPRRLRPGVWHPRDQRLLNTVVSAIKIRSMPGSVLLSTQVLSRRVRLSKIATH